ncbi:MAG: hypothetical protein ACI85N_002113 [Gammaproteobacteria bacterium]|jgi:hypothetical protein
MSKTKFISKMIILFNLILIYPLPVFASEYACSMQAVLELNDVGQYKAHGWVANYLNRKFFVNRETGKVTGTTALKARLTNFDKTHSPKVLHNADEKASYKVVTLFEDKGQFSSLRIYENVKSDEKPYAYQTAVGMLISGTCIEDPSKN